MLLDAELYIDLATQIDKDNIQTILASVSAPELTKFERWVNSIAAAGECVVGGSSMSSETAQEIQRRIEANVPLLLAWFKSNQSNEL